MAGEVNLKVPKLRRQTFETAIIERYRRRESSVEEALIEMYLVGHFSPPGGGHHRGAMGHPCQPEHGVEPEQEDLREDRGLAEPADRGRDRARDDLRASKMAKQPTSSSRPSTRP